MELRDIIQIVIAILFVAPVAWVFLWRPPVKVSRRGLEMSPPEDEPRPAWPKLNDG